MDQQRIKQLIDLVAESDLSELTLSESGSTLTLTRHAITGDTARVPAAASSGPSPAQATAQPAAMAAPAPLAAATPAAVAIEVCSPLYGVLHLTPSPNEPAFIAVGDSVAIGQTLCVVEAMKMFHQVKATQVGRVEAILAAAGDEVESGQALFRII